MSFHFFFSTYRHFLLQQTPEHRNCLSQRPFSPQQEHFVCSPFYQPAHRDGIEWPVIKHLLQLVFLPGVKKPCFSCLSPKQHPPSSHEVVPLNQADCIVNINTSITASMVAAHKWDQAGELECQGREAKSNPFQSQVQVHLGQAQWLR